MAVSGTSQASSSADGDDCRALAAREPIFHRAEFGTSPAEFAALITDDYWEVGASGRVYTRDVILDILADRHRLPVVDDDWRVVDFGCHQLAADLFQATYTLWQGDRCTRRSTLWRRTADSWRAVYHQGTVVQDV